MAARSPAWWSIAWGIEKAPSPYGWTACPASSAISASHRDSSCSIDRDAAGRRTHSADMRVGARRSADNHASAVLKQLLALQQVNHDGDVSKEYEHANRVHLADDLVHLDRQQRTGRANREPAGP